MHCLFVLVCLSFPTLLSLRILLSIRSLLLCNSWKHYTLNNISMQGFVAQKNTRGRADEVKCGVSGYCEIIATLANTGLRHCNRLYFLMWWENKRNPLNPGKAKHLQTSEGEPNKKKECRKMCVNIEMSARSNLLSALRSRSLYVPPDTGLLRLGDTLEEGGVALNPKENFLLHMSSTKTWRNQDGTVKCLSSDSNRSIICDAYLMTR